MAKTLAELQSPSSDPSPQVQPRGRGLGLAEESSASAGLVVEQSSSSPSQHTSAGTAAPQRWALSEQTSWLLLATQTTCK